MDLIDALKFCLDGKKMSNTDWSPGTYIEFSFYDSTFVFGATKVKVNMSPLEKTGYIPYQKPPLFKDGAFVIYKGEYYQVLESANTKYHITRYANRTQFITVCEEDLRPARKIF